MRWILAIPLFYSTGLSGIPDDLFTEGNDAMIKERYEDAIQAYESLLDLEYESSDPVSYTHLTLPTNREV